MDVLTSHEAGSIWKDFGVPTIVSKEPEFVLFPHFFLPIHPAWGNTVPTASLTAYICFSLAFVDTQHWGGPTCFPFSHTHSSTPAVIVTLLLICHHTWSDGRRQCRWIDAHPDQRKNGPTFRAGKEVLNAPVSWGLVDCKSCNFSVRAGAGAEGVGVVGGEGACPGESLS